MVASLLLLLASLGQPAPDTVVVLPQVFRQAMEPWLEYRAAQGHQIALVSAELSAEEIRGQIRRIAEGGGLRFVVLVGDAEPAMRFDSGVRARCVPVHWAKAEVVSLWDSPPHIGTDNWYADLDDDAVPDVAVGRLTADSPGELSRIVEKTLDYERSADFGEWRRRLNFIAGVGGFSRMADAVLETAAKALLTRNVPPDYRLSMTYGSWQSPYCPAPESFRQTTLERLNEGCWFWVYLGHGYHLGLDRIRTPDGDYPILDMPDLGQLGCRHAAPIAVFLACYTGAFDAWEDCLAEQMLRTPGGPVAVLAGSRVTMPYAMTVLGTGLLDAVFREHSPTLGEAVLYAKRQMMRQASQAGPERAALDLIALAISPSPSKLDVERREHVQLFNLIGDPLLRIRYPKPVSLELPTAIGPGGRLQVDGTCPVDGRAVVELILPRTQPAGEPPTRAGYPDSAGRQTEFESVYRRANDGRLAHVEVQVTGGRLHAELPVPDDARGNCQVRVFVEGQSDFAQATATVAIGAAETVAEKPSAAAVR
jgi:hypothetical protein